MNYTLYAAMTVLAVFLFAISEGGMSLSSQKVYAQTAPTLSDQPSCEGLPSTFEGSTSWDSSSNTCTVDGTLTIPSDTQLSVSGVTLRIAESATLNNNGDPLYNENFGTIENLGTINNYGGITPNDGNFDNSGTLNNYGAIAYYGDTFTNSGVLNNYGSDSSAASGFGGIHLYSTGGEETPEAGNPLENSGTINNNGGIYLNDNSIANSGTLHNHDDGIIVNFRSIGNYGSIVNDGMIDNSFGAIFNFCGSSFSGPGTVEGNQPQDSCGNEPPSDTEAPQVTFNVEDRKGKQLSDGSTTNSKDIRIEFTATDNVGVTTVECSLDGPGTTTFDKQFSPCTSPIELNKLAKGTYTFTDVATDEAENQGTYTFKWIVKQP